MGPAVAPPANQGSDDWWVGERWRGGRKVQIRERQGGWRRRIGGWVHGATAVSSDPPSPILTLSKFSLHNCAMTLPVTKLPVH